MSVQLVTDVPTGGSFPPLVLGERVVTQVGASVLHLWVTHRAARES